MSYESMINNCKLSLVVCFVFIKYLIINFWERQMIRLENDLKKRIVGAIWSASILCHDLFLDANELMHVWLIF